MKIFEFISNMFPKNTLIEYVSKKIKICDPIFLEICLLTLAQVIF